MQYSTVITLLGCISQVLATNWYDAKCYTTPDNCDNKCSDSQKKGYDWSGLEYGTFTSYGSNKFSGFSCSSLLGKRDPLLPRTFQDKCITGDVQKHPSISCDSGKAMSIDKMHISSEHDTHIECHYGMPDGSTCKTVHSCSSKGSVIKNDQCGGAIGVTFKPAHGNTKSCSIGVHDISFNCAPPPSKIVTTSTGPATTLTIQTTSLLLTSSTTIVATTSAPQSYTVSSLSTSTPTNLSTADVKSSSSLFTPSIPVYVYPSSSTAPASSSSLSSVNLPDTTTTTTVSTTPSSSIPATSSPAPQCPGVLPSCLNTWLYQTQCKDNSDYDCFCKDSSFVNHVMECLSAWGGVEDDTHKGASYFQGLCAQYIPQNPAIITACPKQPELQTSAAAYTTTTVTTIFTTAVTTRITSGSTAIITKVIPVTTTVCPVTVSAGSTAAAKSSPAPTAWAVPVTVITYSTVLTVQVTCSTGESAGSIIPGSSTAVTVQTVLTAPQVYLTSAAVTAAGVSSSVNVGLATGPAPVPAQTTGIVTTYATGSKTRSTGAVYTGKAAAAANLEISAMIFGGGIAALMAL